MDLQLEADTKIALARIDSLSERFTGLLTRMGAGETLAPGQEIQEPEAVELDAYLRELAARLYGRLPPKRVWEPPYGKARVASLKARDPAAVLSAHLAALKELARVLRIIPPRLDRKSTDIDCPWKGNTRREMAAPIAKHSEYRSGGNCRHRIGGNWRRNRHDSPVWGVRDASVRALRWGRLTYRINSSWITRVGLAITSDFKPR